MKATGIVRRIDELGRVVIPKEIRSTLRLKSGDPLEIFTDRDELMLKKYSPIASLEKFSEGTAKSLSELSGHLAIVCDTDEVLHASGSGKREVAGKAVPYRRRGQSHNCPDYRAHSFQRRLSGCGGACFHRAGRKNRTRGVQAGATFGNHFSKSVRISGFK